MKSDTKRKAVAKVKLGLPEEASKFAEVVDSIINIESPDKRAALDARGIHRTPLRRKIDLNFHCQQEMKKALKETKSSRKTKDLEKKAEYCRVFLQANRGRPIIDLRKELNISWWYFQKCLNGLDKEPLKRKQRSDTLSPDVKNSVQNFLNRGDVS